MTFRNEVMDFVATYKAMSPTSQDRYYDILREEAQRKRKKDDAVEKARQDAYKRAKQGYPTPQSNVPTVASTNTPGMAYPTTGAPTAAPAPDTAWSHGNPGAIDTNWPEFAAMRRGGPVRRYQQGGSVRDPLRDAVERNTNKQGRELIERDLDKPQLNRPSSDQYMREKGYPSRKDVPKFQRGGSVQRYDVGGNVTAEDEQSEADLILQGILRRETEERARSPATAQQISDVVGTSGSEHSPYYVPQQQVAAARPGADLPMPQDQAITLKTPQRATSWVDRNIVDPIAQRARPAINAIVGPLAEGRTPPEIRNRQGQLVDPEGNVLPDQTPSKPIRYYGSGRPEDADPDYLNDPENAAARARARRVGELRPSPTERLTPDELAAREAEIAQLTAVDEERRPSVPTPASIAIPGVNAPFTPDQRAAAAAAAARGNGPAVARDAMPEMAPNDAAAIALRPPGVYGPVPPNQRTATGDPDPASVQPPTPYPSKPGRPQPGKPQQQAGGPGGPGPSGGTTGPGSGNGSVAAPPPGTARTEDPRTRTAAFDPGRERINPDQTTAPRHLDQQGNVIMPTPQELQQMVATAAQGRVGANGGAPPIGDGAVSRQSVQQLVGQYNQGGALSEGQALMAGMHAAYRVLLSQGRSKEAAEMAWGILQAANLEAASLGMVARDQVRNGDIAGARTTIAKALDWAPDGTRHVATPYGIDSYDMNGNLVSRSVIDGKKALALALGLSDGTAVWQALEQTVASMKPADKDAEGRQLRNDLTRLRIAREQQRLRGGGGGKGGESEEARNLRIFLSTGDLPTMPKTDGGGGGSSDENRRTYG